VCFLPRTNILARADGIQQISFHDYVKGTEPFSPIELPSVPRDICVDRQGKLVATSMSNQKVMVHEIATGKVQAEVSVPKPIYRTPLALSPQGQYLATPGAGNSLVVHRIGAREEPIELRGHLVEISSLGFSPRGRMLASASADGTVIVWDLKLRLPY